MIQSPPLPGRNANSTRRILLASLAGTTIEFFDFYIFATAAVLVFPKLFFPTADPVSARMESLATFAFAFYARPVGSAVFGHFGDRIGRKATLVAALLTMGVSTVAIGLLPTYGSIGVAAPILLALCRLGQGLGLGGEWGGAILLATENAPPGRRAWFGMFPQLGAPLGFLLSGGTFLILSATLTDAQFLRFGWRIPFIASSLLVGVGLYVRLKITETPVFRQAMEKEERVRVPILSLCAKHGGAVVIGTLMAVATFLLFYILTVFCLSWGTSRLGFDRERFLLMQMAGTVFFALAIPFSAALADRHGRRVTLMLISVAIAAFGFVFAPLFGAGQAGALLTMIAGLSLMGMSYGPLGTVLSELFPTPVRYSGSSISFNLAGIFGAAPAPLIAMWLANRHGLPAVGWYLSGAALLSFAALWLSRETRDVEFAEGSPTAALTLKRETGQAS
jgi:metabolite-proton symporter